MYFVRIHYEPFRLLVRLSTALWHEAFWFQRTVFSFSVCLDPPYFTVVDFCFCFMSRLSIAS